MKANSHFLKLGKEKLGRKKMKRVETKQLKAYSDSSELGDGEDKDRTAGRHFTHGYHLVKGKPGHAMEDYVAAQCRKIDDSEDVADYLQAHLFDNILNEPDFWTDPESAIKNSYRETDNEILEEVVGYKRGGSTAVTAIFIDGEKLVVANVGDSRAVICGKGVSKQLSVDHEPKKERETIESKGGFVTEAPGDVKPRGC
ncbi:hypothetical protein AAC387_Pa06g1518 [Persea americana]